MLKLSDSNIIKAKYCFAKFLIITEWRIIRERFPRSKRRFLEDFKILSRQEKLHGIIIQYCNYPKNTFERQHQALSQCPRRLNYVLLELQGQKSLLSSAITRGNDLIPLIKFLMFKNALPKELSYVNVIKVKFFTAIYYSKLNVKT